MYNMLRKTGAHSTVALVLAAVRCGLLPLETLPEYDLAVWGPQEKRKEDV